MLLSCLSPAHSLSELFTHSASGFATLVQSHDRWRVYTHMQLLQRMIAAVHGGALSWALLVLPDTAE